MGMMVCRGGGGVFIIAGNPEKIAGKHKRKMCGKHKEGGGGCFGQPVRARAKKSGLWTRAQPEHS